MNSIMPAQVPEYLAVQPRKVFIGVGKCLTWEGGGVQNIKK